MIPFTSCMCPTRAPVQRQGRWLLVSQKDAEEEAEKSEDISFFIQSSGDQKNDRNLTSYFYQAWYISRRLSRRAVITPVDGLHVLDNTYWGTAQALLSRCNRWSFNTFNLDVSTGGRSLPFLLFHLFQEYGFINYFCLDAVKVWRCFNLMEACYHRHNPYHNSVHAADVTQAMHCFLQENKFADHLTPLEAMAAIIAAVAHDLDHPGVTQTFLVATSNHLVNLYKNSSVLENHHWRTAISCLLESGIFNHLGKDIWLDIQRQIRSLILATDITRQKEFLCRFKKYLSSQVLDMEKDNYRHFALQIALKCADLCNPCRPWAISQRWSFQVCQEFYRQGSFEWQLNLPLTPSFDCSRTRIPKIQTDFFQHVVMPLFETWDNFLNTRLSNLLLKNLQYNYIQWQDKMEVMDVQQINIKTANMKSLCLLKEDCNENKTEPTSVPQHVKILLKSHKSHNNARNVSQLLSSKCHLQTYCAEELHPLTSLLSLSSVMSTVLLRKACIVSEIESRLLCMNVMQPFLKRASEDQVQDKTQHPPPNTFVNSAVCENDRTCSHPIDDIKSKAQFTPTVPDPNGCCTPLLLSHEHKSSQENAKHCQSSSFLSTFTGLKQQKYRILDSEKDTETVRQNNAKSILNSCQKFDNKNTKTPSSNSSCSNFYHPCFHTAYTGKTNATKTSLCSTKNVQKIIAPVKITASWCWHIRRSLSAERPQQPSQDFDILFSTYKGSSSCQTCNKNSGRRGSAPVPSVWSRENSQTLNLGSAMDDRRRLVAEAEGCGPTVRRWSIPLEPISS